MRRRSIQQLRLALLAVGVALAGCSSGGETNSDAAVPGPCGDAAPCTMQQLCVSVQLCGATPTCMPVPDAGECPAGSSATPSCPDTGMPGCLAGCSVAYSCQARPAGCAASVDCTCAAPLCSPGTCLIAVAGRVACEAP